MLPWLRAPVLCNTFQDIHCHSSFTQSLFTAFPKSSMKCLVEQIVNILQHPVDAA
ncbi:hypothetical protein AVDCRST_MAG94-1742 [uncultured Leptolyngbya sp.]|uniref:Uncharacterized protein n=1 Tax=uncultured Leptolyngbya sp. TaxID=332963 RepID=A0A6J4LBF8_9CYAN|nr:hypothetical protein AVDCRST_MAG94-1742 [uncultured Leptolyngbya sp.]